MSEDLARLCHACGLCCDGSLFGRVGLEADEVAPARARRLHVLANGRAFEQPCSALGGDGQAGAQRSCAIYEDRPRACRRFACRLYARHAREGGPLEARLEAVRRVRELLAKVEASRGDRENDAATEDGDTETSPDLLELRKRLEDDFARAND